MLDKNLAIFLIKVVMEISISVSMELVLTWARGAPLALCTYVTASAWNLENNRYSSPLLFAPCVVRKPQTRSFLACSARDRVVELC